MQIPDPTAIDQHPALNGPFQGKTILIVDDTPANIDILNELLTAFKRKVATNGVKALELAASDPMPDLILLDIDMPEMDGFEVCEKLKSEASTRAIPVIFLTAHTDKRSTVKGFQLGASDFLTKPFDPDELMVRVKTQLELKDSREKLEGLVRQLEISSALLKQSNDETNEQKRIIEEEKKRSDHLLRTIFPESVANELKEKGHAKASRFQIATVLFADLKDFTSLSKGMSPEEMLAELSWIFTGLDLIVEKNNMEKIKTIGDGYMAVGGLPVPNNTNPVDAVQAGLEIADFVERTSSENKKSGKPGWKIRVGIHTGEVVAGVIGKNKFSYDIFGTTVNTASRMESASEEGKVNISGITYQLVKDKFACTYRGNIEVKNMGKMDMYFAQRK